MQPLTRLVNRLGWALIVVLGIAAYANTLEAPFLFDDLTVLVANPGLRTLHPIVPTTSRWLTDLTFRLNYRLHGLDVYGYHVVNLLIHLGAGLLTLGVLRRVFALPRLGARINRAASSLALVTALLWVVHPLQTQAVTYLCQRYESLMGLFLLATVYTFLRGVDNDGKTSRARRRARWWFDGSIACCLLGMGTKEVMAVAPALILLLDLVLVATRPAEALRTRWRVHLALWLTLGALLLFTLRMLQAGVRLEQSHVAAISSWTYLMTQSEVILHYLRLAIWPHPLCLDYAWPYTEGWQAVWFELLALSTAGFVTLAGLWRRRPWAVAAAWTFMALAPSSSILPLPDAAFEHRMYVALLGVLALLVGGGYRLLADIRPTRLRRGLCVTALILAIGGGTALTHRRNRDYGSELRMWSDVVAKRPGNLRGRIDYAIALSQAGKDVEAVRQYETVLAVIPADKRARYERGDVPPGRFGTLTDRYHYFRAQANYGALLLERNRTEAAVRRLVLALRVAPRHPAAEPLLRKALDRLGVPADALDRHIAGLVLGHIPLPEAAP